MSASCIDTLVDALPYIDQGYNEPGVREASLALVEEETQRLRSSRSHAHQVPQPDVHRFETALMRSEYERLVASRLPLDVLNMRRYELPAPPAGRLTDVSAWTECVQNSMAQLEHQSTRIDNLQLMLEHGCDAWRMVNDTIAKYLVAGCQRQLTDVKQQIHQVNWERKQVQLKAGDEISVMESLWVSLVSKNYEIEQACVELEMQIAKLNDEISISKSEQELQEENIVD